MYRVFQDYGKPCVLIAEDNEDNLLMLSLALEGYGISHIGISSNQNLFRLVQRYDPQVVLLDIWPSNVWSIDVLKALKQHPLTHHIPVVVMTALVNANSLERIVSAGCDDYIAKPFALDELYRLICQYLTSLPYCVMPPYFSI